MYALILILLIGTGVWLIKLGLDRARRAVVVLGAAVLVLTIGFFGSLSLWGEMLWFDALGYARRFWLFLGSQAAVAAGGAIVAGAISFAIIWTLKPRLFRNVGVAVAAVGGIVWGARNWSDMLVFLNRVHTGMVDPVFGQDTGFFLFVLPFLDKLHGLALFATLVGLGTAAATAFILLQQGDARWRGGAAERFSGSLLTGSAMLAVVLAAGLVLDAYRLVFSDFGVVRGAGWTDLHVRLPTYFGMAAVLVVLAALPLIQPIRQWLSRRVARITTVRVPLLNALAAVWVGIGVLWGAALVVAPAITQWLIVVPNEITYERPYIERNIRFTRHGFHLDKIEERQFPASEVLTRRMVRDNRDLLSEVRLWDWRALDAVYKQFQEIRLYYEFVDVDMDRYHFGGRYRQVMASARELAQDNLAAESQTFVNRRFKYTHGYGLTLATVSDFTEEGLPNLLVKDIPPESKFPRLEVTRPEIYYGELTYGPVVVNSDEEEFDYPRGEKNQYIHYPGEGGVRLSNLWRKFLFGWKFDGTRFFFSGYPRAESRVMFHRQVQERVQRVAPFLEFDEDPYIVLVDGRLYWFIDAYTTSRHLPYSEPFSSHEFVQFRGERGIAGFSRRTAVDLHGVNYVRNSVKAVVDAFEGSVDLYVFEPEDPVIQVWQRVLPNVLKNARDMPPAMRAHIRYPQDFLLVQGLVYAKYHMRDPEVFYNQEDLWVRATEKHYDRVQPVEPYYVMWELPGSDRAEFVLIQPFTPKNRQVLIGWIAGMSDGDNYGRFLAYKFPKEKRIIGPQQVETKIDQDSFLSGQLTLWDQRGSSVIRGNVLAIPIDNTILYVEPIYLQAETAAYPELRLVVAMHGDTMAYAETFDEALNGLFKDKPPGLRRDTRPGAPRQDWARDLNRTFNAYLNALGNKEFDTAAAQLKKLNRLIEQATRTEEGANARTAP